MTFLFASVHDLLSALLLAALALHMFEFELQDFPGCECEDERQSGLGIIHKCRLSLCKHVRRKWSNKPISSLDMSPRRIFKFPEYERKREEGKKCAVRKR